ncbi:MAG: class I SAM-dependent methyltransferase [Planctomycetes bacterium]|nr:class I SAM-dependent methyltransferase [Planctomycetota bacterium]
MKHNNNNTIGRLDLNMPEQNFYELSQSAFKQRPDCAYCHIPGDKIGPIYQPNFFTFPVGKVSVEKDLYNNINLRKCKQCGLLYKDAVVMVEVQAQIYKESNHRYNYKATNKYITRKVEIIRQMCKKENSHLLDIGCHTGDFLKLARAAGFKTSGADYSDTAYLGHEAVVSESFYKGLIEEVQFPDNCFDFITAWDVFEHLYDVSNALKKIYTALKPGGYLFIETGDVSSFGARLRSPNNWWYVCGLGHFNFFDIGCIRRILGDAGFDGITAERVRHKSIGDLNLLEYGQQLCKSMAFSVSPKAYKYIMGLMSKSGGGTAFPCKDHIFVIAQK